MLGTSGVCQRRLRVRLAVTGKRMGRPPTGESDVAIDPKTVRCVICGGPMYVKHSNGNRYYRCTPPAEQYHPANAVRKEELEGWLRVPDFEALDTT